ncbi:Gfo/Idh/MocA family protein [Virgibacillus necropolis]|uniref:Dehydrogenase n=1 Tax=Virgibacillus necropolis TaxID=163877 RepID=A0A221MAF8_9BACI|nr:Gfo/Idh/MocA family oxidoreductase [Virgibacillus necropolis]ASN04602.1 dehydrogenase [Virgibacillus necropolis]
MKVALLSRWHVHADDYARAVHENDQLTVELVWDEDSERGKKWADELGVPFEKELEVVLSDPEIDAVIVSTPTNLHKEIILAAAAHKKHVFTEKVLAFTAEECDNIYDAAAEHDVELMVSLPRLTEKEFLYAEKAVNEGWIGMLTMIRCRLAHNGAVVPEGETQGWLPARFFDKEQTGGGSLIDLGAHPIYLTNRLAGRAEAVYSRLQQDDEKKVDVSAAVIVEYESGALGMIETSFLSHGSPFQLELYGTEGTLLCTDGAVQLKSIHHGDGNWLNLEEELPSVLKPLEQWVAKIRNGVEPSITKEDVINLTKINDAAAFSHLKGCRIFIEK